MAAIAVSSIDDLERGLARVGRLRARRDGVRAVMKAFIARVSEVASWCERLVAGDLEALEAEIARYAQERRADLLSGERGKTVHLCTGTLSWRASTKVVIENETAAVLGLRKARHGVAVIMVNSVDKDWIKRNADLIEGIEGLRVERAETLTITPVRP